MSERESQELISSKDLVLSLNRLFPEQQFDKNFQITKQILGETVSLMTTEQIKDVMTEVHFLVSSWLDDYERSIFGNLTLKELLHERSGI